MVGKTSFNPKAHSCSPRPARRSSPALQRRIFVSAVLLLLMLLLPFAFTYQVSTRRSFVHRCARVAIFCRTIESSKGLSWS